MLSKNGSNNRPSNLPINCLNNIENIEVVLEQFFEFHASFLWDRAKDFIERQRDLFRSEHSHVPSILASLFNGLAQLTVADKNYLTVQFFSSKVFQRKDKTVKCSYENLKQEFIRLEDRGKILSQNFILATTQSSSTSPIHNSNLDANKPTEGYDSRQNSFEPALDALSCDLDEVIQNDNLKLKSTNSETAESVPKGNSFFMKASKFFGLTKSSSSNSPKLTEPACSFIVGETVEESDQNGSEHNCNVESLDCFAAHLCGQLIHYCRVRIEMIDLYEKLSTVCSVGNFCLVDDCLKTVTDIHTFADRNFHHPVFVGLKSLFLFELEILLALLRVHVYIQDWKFLDCLFYIQEAQSKLTVMANMREFLRTVMNHKYVQSSLSSTMVKNSQSSLLQNSVSNNIRNNITSSSSLSSSGSSSLSVPVVANVPNQTPTGNINNYSPMSTSTNFIFPHLKEGSISNFSATNPFGANGSVISNASAKMFRNFNPSSMPLLIQWLNHYKLFLLSKYSFYFHSLLMVNLTPSSISSFVPSLGSSSSLTAVNNSSASNYAQTEALMRQLCNKHLYDFHSRISTFMRKCDSSYVILIYDSHGKTNISLSGYRSPYVHKEIPKGINSYPIIYSYPGEFPKNRIPSLIMIMNDRMKELNSTDSVVVEYDKPSPTTSSVSGGPDSSGSMGANLSTNGTTTGQHGTQLTHHSQQPQPQHRSSSFSGGALPNAAYFLARPDPNFTLAVISEAKRTERDSLIVSFMKEMCTLLKGDKILVSLRTGNFK